MSCSIEKDLHYNYRLSSNAYRILYDLQGVQQQPKQVKAGRVVEKARVKAAEMMT